MSRFGWLPGTRRNGWSGTAPEERSRPTSPEAPRARPVLTPDRDSRLSDGVVIETRLRARLLGAPLLKVDGTVLVSPARLVASTPPPVVRGDVVSGGARFPVPLPGARERHRARPSLRRPGCSRRAGAACRTWMAAALVHRAVLVRRGEHDRRACGDVGCRPDPGEEVLERSRGGHAHLEDVGLLPRH